MIENRGIEIFAVCELSSHYFIFVDEHEVSWV